MLLIDGVMTSIPDKMSGIQGSGAQNVRYMKQAFCGCIYRTSGARGPTVLMFGTTVPVLIPLTLEFLFLR